MKLTITESAHAAIRASAHLPFKDTSTPLPNGQREIEIEPQTYVRLVANRRVGESDSALIERACRANAASAPSNLLAGTRHGPPLTITLTENNGDVVRRERVAPGMQPEAIADMIRQGGGVKSMEHDVARSNLFRVDGELIRATPIGPNETVDLEKEAERRFVMLTRAETEEVLGRTVAYDDNGKVLMTDHEADVLGAVLGLRDGLGTDPKEVTDETVRRLFGNLRDVAGPEVAKRELARLRRIWKGRYESKSVALLGDPDLGFVDKHYRL